jgi:hypothetical protein
MDHDDTGEVIAQNFQNQDDSLNYDTLNTINMGSSLILTLEEALKTVGINVESKPFMIKLENN